MNSRVLVGVGNIYASEALFLSGIRPQKRAGTINRKQYDLLASSIKDLLQSSIDKGGTTLRDFVGGDSKPGYFKNELLVYGRSGQSCKSCSTLLKQIRLSQRSSVYCPKCQS
jgi:formamidopyrimidine-DNA glycosylase